jgi:hypothetical protein
MRKKLSYALLLGAVLSAPLLAIGQAGSSKATATNKVQLRQLEAAMTYNPMISNVISNNSVWMQGGSAQLDGLFWRGLNLTADFSGQHIANMHTSGVGLDLVTTTFGPRYRWQRSGYTFYGQMLVGEAFGMHSIFPGVTGSSDSSSSLALLGGGGINRQLSKRVAVRLFEANWMHTQMPNSTTNAQNNLRLGMGLVVRIN